MRHRLFALPAALLALLLTVSTVAAGSYPAEIRLPNGWAPEGITAGHGSTVYVGSLATGAIAKINVKTGKVNPDFAPGATGRVTVGVDFDFHHDRIWAAGGNTHEVRAYSARGKLLQTYTFTSGFLNDVAVTRHAVYVTDSNMQQLIVIPLGRHGKLPDPSKAFTLPITGDFVYQAGFNANGIENLGRWLIVPQSNTGALYAINGKTGRSHELLPPGSVDNADGLELRGGKLYIVRNADAIIDVYRFGFFGLKKVKTLTSDAFDVPTTAAWQDGKLWVVNARFGTPVTPDTEYRITKIRP
jgi:hypothetical protein